MDEPIWYAQRQEDRRLAHYLGDFSHGFFVDIGAWEPDLDSVTKYFYDRHWTGVNVEPIPYYHAKLVAARPKDLNLLAAVSDKSAENVEFSYIEGTGLSTFVPEHVAAGSVNRVVTKLAIRTITLEKLCRQYVPVNKTIDFLKIDVEGWEKQVIIGGDWKRYRPSIVVVEATIPGTETPAWSTWEPILIAEEYDFIEFDGLNRWYKAKEYTLANQPRN